MKQGEHEVLDNFTVLKKFSIVEVARTASEARQTTTRDTRQPVFLHLAIAAAGRISEKNAAFLTHFDHNGWCGRFEVPASLRLAVPGTPKRATVRPSETGR
jgi:hypothetical protein